MNYLYSCSITVFCLLLMLPFPDVAQAKDVSNTYEINLTKVEDKGNNGTATINMVGKVNVSSLLGEPLVACNTKWSFWKGVTGQPNITIDNVTINEIPQDVLDEIKLHSIKLSFATLPLNDQMFSENTWYELSCDPGAVEPAGSEKASYTVPGSPSWDKTFHVRDTYDGFDKDAATFADEATAKQIMIKLLDEGFLTDSDSAKILSAKINLSPVKKWLDKQKKGAEDKLKEKEKKAKEDKAAANEEDDFWNGEKNDKKETAKSESEKNGFWSGEEQSEEQEAKNNGVGFWSGEDQSKTTKDDFWAGNTETVREEIDGKKREVLAKVEKQRQGEELEVFKNGNLYGFKNNSGEIVIGAEFASVKDFSEGLAAVRLPESLWGFINKSGSWVIPAKYKIDSNYGDLGYFKNNRAIVATHTIAEGRYTLIIDQADQVFYRKQAPDLYFFTR